MTALSDQVMPSIEEMKQTHSDGMVSSSDQVTSSSGRVASVKIDVQQKDSDAIDSMGKWHHVEACLPDDREGKYYADNYRCRPPPIFILFITLLELGFFVYYSAVAAAASATPDLPSVTSDPPSVTSVTPDLPLGSMGTVPLDSVLLYRPDRHWQLWRLVTYMVLHTSWWHLSFNLLVQLAVGLPLEMVHGSTRVAAIYLAGVLAGSLGTSVSDAGRQVYLVGASGGVYALLTAHIANVLLNYNYMELGIQRLLLILLIAGCDVALAIYHRYSLVLPPVEPAVSYTAHLAGGVAGLSLGLVILRNFSPKQRQPLIWWLALGVIIACALFAIAFNVFSVDRGRQYV